jgi:hypothetical protein
LDVFEDGPKCTATVEMKPANAPGFPLASGVIGRRVALVWAAVVDVLVKVWDAGSEDQMIHPINLPLQESAFSTGLASASGWLCLGQLIIGAPGPDVKELVCTGLGVASGGEVYTVGKVPSQGCNLAGEVLNRALERYHRPDGYEGSLVDAAWEIEQIGREVWPALWDLVMEGGPECEHFLGTVVRLEGVDPQARLKALLTAARNPDPDVRSRLLELLEEMPAELRAEVLWELTADERPDDGVTDQAREVWHAQAF